MADQQKPMTPIDRGLGSKDAQTRHEQAGKVPAPKSEQRTTTDTKGQVETSGEVKS